ncbi:N-acetylmuramoyl-L-alanine amidase-like domain-containing protein [Hallella colorans]|jgi:hypothetical protein|uniref:N-acetylmuramoyl-L-alanine amidase-like domain-containing protein n=1 Tax=Hallella colorans TaxID=1703337 RepID=UPI0023F01EAD|nr:N-acetylmuramoyl-L-alanine amidase-like domain-containing protein [Hallella colorans]
MVTYKKIFFSLLFLCSCYTGHAAKPDYWRSDSIKVARLLRKATLLDSGSNLLIYFARELRGLPYMGKTLERNKEERLVINLRQMDCTTYVETVLALTMCAKKGYTTFDQFVRNLRMVRYEDGEVTYPKRMHYFTHWINENIKKNIVAPIPEPQELFTATQTVKAYYMTTHAHRYPMMAKNKWMTREIRQMEQRITGKQYAYIPKSRLNDSATLRQTIKDGDIIAILTSRAGLDTSHIGIAVWHSDGLHMLNASSVHQKVVEEPMLLKQYMMRHPSQIGIRVVRPL